MEHGEVPMPVPKLASPPMPVVVPVVGPLLLDAAIDQYKASLIKRKKAKRTVDGYGYTLLEFYKSCGNKLLSSITFVAAFTCGRIYGRTKVAKAEDSAFGVVALVLSPHRRLLIFAGTSVANIKRHFGHGSSPEEPVLRFSGNLERLGSRFG
jgi:hypothetical protein